MNALSRHLKTAYFNQYNPPASFLCLGLTSVSKDQFAKSLAKHLALDDYGLKLLIEVDLSICTEPESFSLCKCKNSHDQNFLLIDVVKQRPHPSVIVFYELEMAHISVFNSILSILDSGVFEDNHGNIIDFRNFVVVIVYDLGDKEMIARLNGHNPEEKKKIIQKSLLTTADGKKGVGSRSEKKIIQKPLPDGKKGVKKKGLRSELLNQLEHLLAFDPLSDDQLNQFADFPMKSLKEEQYCSFFLTFFYLFHVRGPKKVRYNAANMVRSLMKARRNAKVPPPTVDVL